MIPAALLGNKMQNDSSCSGAQNAHMMTDQELVDHEHMFGPSAKEIKALRRAKQNAPLPGLQITFENIFGASARKTEAREKAKKNGAPLTGLRMNESTPRSI
jgi:hypothetical protein